MTPHSPDPLDPLACPLPCSLDFIFPSSPCPWPILALTPLNEHWAPYTPACSGWSDLGLFSSWPTVWRKPQGRADGVPCVWPPDPAGLQMVSLSLAHSPTLPRGSLQPSWAHNLLPCSSHDSADDLSFSFSEKEVPRNLPLPTQQSIPPAFHLPGLLTPNSTSIRPPVPSTSPILPASFSTLFP